MINKKVVLFDIDYTLFDTKMFKESLLTKYVSYEEVLTELGELSKFAELGIFSKGEMGFQNVKLEETGLSDFFKKENIHVFKDKDMFIGNVLDKYKQRNIFLVDDKLTTLQAAKRHLSSVFTIWVKRGPFAKAQAPIENFTPDAIIYNLTDITKIIDSN